MSKTSETTILARFAALAVAIAGVIIGFLALVGIGGLVLPVLLGAVAGIGFLVLFCWAGTHLFGYLMFRNDPRYQEWLRYGDPWFDTLPPPFNNDSMDERFQGNCQRLVCPCGTIVGEPFFGAFRRNGVSCPTCGNVLRSG